MERIEIAWGERRVVAELHRTTKRSLRISVRPTGEVTVFAPNGEALGDIQARAARKAEWIFAQIEMIDRRPLTTPPRRFVSGETHLLLGRQYRLSIEQADEADVRIDGTRLVIRARTPEDRTHCRRLLRAFYALKARDVFRERFDIVVDPFVRRGLNRPSLIIRHMSKRWGSFTPGGRVVLNTDLVRASPRLIDYVICHELAHGFYPDHGNEWRALFDAVMPDWQDRKLQLEGALR